MNLRTSVLAVAAVAATALAAGPVFAQIDDTDGAAPRSVPPPEAVQPVYLEAEDLLPALESFDAPGERAPGIAVARRENVEDVASGNAQVTLTNEDPGTRLTLRFEVPAGGAYNVSARLPRTAASGIVQPLVDGRPLGDAVDLHAAERGYVDLLLGRLELAAGAHTFTLVVTGKAEASGGLGAGLDYLSLEP
jgi:hypothetical protein